MSVSIIRCGKCGFDVEVFSDEEDNKCPKCKSDAAKGACKIISEDKYFGYYKTNNAQNVLFVERSL